MLSCWHETCKHCSQGTRANNNAARRQLRMRGQPAQAFKHQAPASSFQLASLQTQAQLPSLQHRDKKPIQAEQLHSSHQLAQAEGDNGNESDNDNDKGICLAPTQQDSRIPDLCQAMQQCHQADPHTCHMCVKDAERTYVEVSRNGSSGAAELHIAAGLRNYGALL